MTRAHEPDIAHTFCNHVREREKSEDSRPPQTQRINRSANQQQLCSIFFNILLFFSVWIWVPMQRRKTHKTPTKIKTNNLCIVHHHHCTPVVKSTQQQTTPIPASIKLAQKNKGSSFLDAQGMGKVAGGERKREKNRFFCLQHFQGSTYTEKNKEEEYKKNIHEKTGNKK